MTKNVVLYSLLITGFGLVATAQEVTNESPHSQVKATAKISCVKADTLKCLGACDGRTPDWITGLEGKYTLVKDSSSKRVKCDPTLLIAMDPAKSVLSVGFQRIAMEKINKPAEINHSERGDLLNATVVMADEKKLVSKERCDARKLSSFSRGNGLSVGMAFGMGKDEEYLELSRDKNSLIRYKWGLNSVGIGSRTSWHFDCIYEKQD